MKPIASLVTDLLAAPLTLSFFAARLFARDRDDDLFAGFSQAASLIPGYLGLYVRRSFYRRTLRSCSTQCYIGFGTLFATRNVEIADNVYIGPRCMIGHARIGEDVLIGSNVDILGGRRQHSIERLDIPIRLQGGEFTAVNIGRDAWIGNGAIIGNDVGAQAVVASGAVVVKPVPPRTIYGGNPAGQIGTRGSAPEPRAEAPAGEA